MSISDKFNSTIETIFVCITLEWTKLAL